jgi:two-component system sensor histidine kinase HydH
MAFEASEEKVKPYRLVKYFTVSSLMVIFLGTLILSVLNTHWARRMLLEQSEDYALLLVENLNHQVLSQFIIPVALKFGKIQLRNKEQSERMDKVVRRTLHGFKVEMVNFYDPHHVVSYSFDKEKIGRENLGGTGFNKAIGGETLSRLTQSGSYWEIFVGVPKKVKIVTFAPLKAPLPLVGKSDPILGVVEIVQDLSDDYKAIFEFQIRVIITCTVVMTSLLLILVYLVKRGEGIIQRRNLERIRLKEQLAKAERLSSLGGMVAGISHEIRNPLGIIRSSAELLKKKMLKFDSQNTIPDIIIEESGRLNNIITDFLDFAKPKEPSLKVCNIEDVIEKNLTFLSSHIQSKGYVISRRFEDNLPNIMADHAMLYQAFLNIFINAMQAMPDGGRITVETYGENGNVCVHFKDEGKGAPEEILDKIWDPFFTTKETGTGLGLGIVKNIIDAHGGNIRLGNEDESGAKVTVELPVSDEDALGEDHDEKSKSTEQ